MHVGADIGGICFVERMFIFVLRMRSFAVAIDFGRCFRTRLEVRPGHEVKNPAAIALIQVEVIGICNPPSPLFMSYLGICQILGVS